MTACALFLAALFAFAAACDWVRRESRRDPGRCWVRRLEQVRRALAYEEPLPHPPGRRV